MSNPPSSGLIDLLTPAEAALLLKVSESFLAKKRMTGDGPAYIKVGRRVRYTATAITAWTRGRQYTSTSEQL